MRLPVTSGTAEHVPMINEHGFQGAVAVLLEDGLSIVGVPRTHVQEPGQPEINSISNASEAVRWENLEYWGVIPTQEPRTKAQPCGWRSKPVRRLDPTRGIALCEFIADDQRAPRGHRKPCLEEQLRSHALVEQQVWALKMIPELDNVERTVTGFRKKWLRSTANLANELCDNGGFLPPRCHHSPKATVR